MSRKIPLSIACGIVSGVLLGLTAQAFLKAQFFPIYSLPLPEMLLIFMLNCFLTSVIVFGGIVFSLIELRFYSHRKAYKALDKTVNPLYFILKRISPEYGKLAPLWRSLYLALSFPLICIFLIVFVIGFYLIMFILSLGFQGLGFSLKLIPHISLEILVFSYAAKIAMDNSEMLKKPIRQKSIDSFRKESRKILKNKKIWKKLLILYMLLLLAAVTEKIFIGM